MLALTYGDPSGIGPEILARFLPMAASCPIRPVVYGDRRVVERGASLAEASSTDVEYQEVPWSGAMPTYGVVDPRCGAHVLAILEKVAQDALSGKIAGVVTGPISKTAVQLICPGFIGHTEFFAQAAGTDDYAMLLVSEPLRALHVTTHIPLRAVAEALTVPRILKTLLLAKRALEMFGEDDLPIGVCALNPHGGESGAFGDEEQALLGPAIAQANSLGVDARGPFAADTVFSRAQRGEFGLVVCMYHDQGHIALKLLGFDRAVNITVGLPFLRTSVAHGTAFDIAGQGKAKAGSLCAAWDLAVKLHRPPRAT